MARRSRKPAAGAIPAELPSTLAPQLATLVESAPRRGEWLYEIKFDGYRFLPRADRAMHLFTRNGDDWTDRLKVLSAELQSLDLGPAWLDGEVVALDCSRLPNFSLLQEAFDKRHTSALVIYLFDLPFVGGWDLRAVPLVERRALLADRLGHGSDHVRLSQTLEGPVKELSASACEMGHEGLMGKLAASPYTSGRTTDWVKLKCARRGTFVIGGVVLSTRSSKTPTLAALKLGAMDDGQLRYAGKVGVGFSEAEGRKMLKLLLPHRRDESPFDIYRSERRWGRADEGETVWVEPNYQIEVIRSEITGWGHVRHASIRGSRLEPRAG